MHIVVVALRVQQTGSTQANSVVSFNGALNLLENDSLRKSNEIFKGKGISKLSF